LEDSPLWLSEPFTRGQAWVDLLMLANHREGSTWKRGILIKVHRGQVAASENELADRWKWSRSKVRNFLKLLQNEQMIRQQKSAVTSTISITNYDRYQQIRQQTIQQKDISKTTEEQQKDNSALQGSQDHVLTEPKNGKNVKKDKNSTPQPPKGEQGTLLLDADERRKAALRLNALFRRKPSTKWSDKERRAMQKIWPIDPEDFALIERYYTTAEFRQGEDYRRRDLLTLLNNWPGEVDRARAWNLTHTPRKASSDAPPVGWQAEVARIYEGATSEPPEYWEGLDQSIKDEIRERLRNAS